MRSSCPVIRATERCTGPPRLLRGGATRKGRAGGREGTRDLWIFHPYPHCDMELCRTLNLNMDKALKIAKNRIEWKNLSHRNAANLTMGACRIQYNTIRALGAQHGFSALASSFYMNLGSLVRYHWHNWRSQSSTRKTWLSNVVKGPCFFRELL